MRVAIVGAGLAGLAAAVELVDAGHEVEMYESRPFTTLRWVCMSFSITMPTCSR
jgi:monoamine oxidase